MRNRFQLSLGMKRQHYRQALDATWRYGATTPGANALTLDEALHLIEQKNKAKATRERHIAEAGGRQLVTPGMIRSRQTFRDNNPAVRSRIKMPVFSIQKEDA